MRGLTIRNADPSRVILLAPLVFALHVLEEAPGLVAWFNSLVQPGISQRQFLLVNATALLVTIVVAGLMAVSREPIAALLALGWLSFLMLANGIFHVVATLVHGRYAPGTITAVALYLPYFGWIFWRTVKALKPSLLAALIVIVVGSLPMAVHGYLIVFKGRRLF